MLRNLKNNLSITIILLVSLNSNCVVKPRDTASNNQVPVMSNNNVSPMVAEIPVEVKPVTHVTGEGNKVNDPVVGWIMALGYASIPLSFFLYLIMHRSKTFRKVSDKLKGKPCGHRDHLSDNNGTG